MDNGKQRDRKLTFREPRRVLAVRDKDDVSLETASSGGAFSVLARPIIDDGGVVFGATLLEDGSVRHVAVNSLVELERLKGSKYVQSDTRGVYKEVASVLESGGRALFSGTPCQCAALVSFLNANGVIGDLESCERLIVCDIICHGTPRTELFRAHQQWLGGRVRADDGVHGWKFRSKRYGWGLYYYYYYYKNGRLCEVCREANSDPYYYAFLKGIIYRSACFKCPFARRERISDFTIGDYWGIEQAHPSFNDTRGVSVMLINTAKADYYFEKSCADTCEYIESAFELASRDNQNLVRPTPMPIGYEKTSTMIERCLREGDYDLLFGRILRPPFSLKRAMKRILPRAMLKMIYDAHIRMQGE